MQSDEQNQSRIVYSHMNQDKVLKEDDIIYLRLSRAVIMFRIFAL